MPIGPESLQNALPSRIPARSRRLAMDWSLVLASQAIQSMIENDPAQGWALLVAAQDEPAAREAIRLYRQENLRWPWRKRVLRQEFVFDWAAAAWVLLIGAFYYLADNRPAFQSGGLMDTTLFMKGEWWRVFTAVWLHANLPHLAANAGFGFILLGLALGHYGTGVGLLAAYLAGAGGNVADELIYGGGHHSLGASGMVMGALGLLAVQSFALRHELTYARKIVLGGVTGAMMLFVMLGVAPESDVVAHLGGFVCGLGLGILLSIRSRLSRNPWLNVIAIVVFALLVIYPWRLALAR